MEPEYDIYTCTQLAVLDNVPLFSSHCHRPI